MGVVMLLNRLFCVLFISVMLFTQIGCVSRRGNAGSISSYPVPEREAEWIRKGMPIEFEGKKWYPADGIEVLLDNEVYLLGEYNGVQFFVDKQDVHPYNRLYTKFSHNKFRFFKMK